MYSEARFKRTIRISKSSFLRIVVVVEDSPEFTNKSTVKQNQISEQVLIASYRIGQLGTNFGPLQVGQKVGVSQGRVVNCTRRFTKVKCNNRLADFKISPPSANQEKENELNNHDEPSGFIGKIEGKMSVCTLISFFLILL